MWQLTNEVLTTTEVNNIIIFVYFLEKIRFGISCSFSHKNKRHFSMLSAGFFVVTSLKRVPSKPVSVLYFKLPFHNGITKTRLFKYIENFTTKEGKFSDKKPDIFHISAQNIDCGYSLELPR